MYATCPSACYFVSLRIVTRRCAGGGGIPEHVRERSHLGERGRCAGKAQHAASMTKHSAGTAQHGNAVASPAMAAACPPPGVRACHCCTMRAVCIVVLRQHDKHPSPLHFAASVGRNHGRAGWVHPGRGHPHQLVCLLQDAAPCQVGKLSLQLRLAGTCGSMQLWQHVYVQACTHVAACTANVSWRALVAGGAWPLAISPRPLP